MFSRGTKTLLRNTIRHTDTHNRILEESDMWKQRDRERVRSTCYQVPKAHMDRERPPQTHAVVGGDVHDQGSTFWRRQLQKAEEADPDRWGHSGYKELYPEEFRATDSDSERESHRKHRKKEERHKKKKKEKKKKKHKHRKEKKKRKSQTRDDVSDRHDKRNLNEGFGDRHGNKKEVTENGRQRTTRGPDVQWIQKNVVSHIKQNSNFQSSRSVDKVHKSHDKSDKSHDKEHKSHDKEHKSHDRSSHSSIHHGEGDKPSSSHRRQASKPKSGLVFSTKSFHSEETDSKVKNLKGSPKNSVTEKNKSPDSDTPRDMPDNRSESTVTKVVDTSGTKNGKSTKKRSQDDDSESHSENSPKRRRKRSPSTTSSDSSSDEDDYSKRTKRKKKKVPTATLR